MLDKNYIYKSKNINFQTKDEYVDFLARWYMKR